MEEARQHSAVTTDMGSRIFGVDRSTRITFAICIGPIVAVCVAGALDGAWIEGVLGAAAFGFMWLWYVTLKIDISSSRVTARRLGRAVWTADRAQLKAYFGRGGELKTHVALVLESPDERRPFQVFKVQFGTVQLGQIAKMLGVKQEVPGGIF